MAAAKGEQTPAEMAKRFDGHASQFATWKEHLLGGAASVFGHESHPAEPPLHIKSLHVEIGDPTLENDF